MWDTSGRLLRLLALLQGRRAWNADELAHELAVTPRTVRRDVARLRDLGYPVAATFGTGGGYQLEAGASLPPLMLDIDEAVSVVLALRSSASGSADASGSSVLSALDKLTRVMPPRLRNTITSITAHSSEVDLGSLIAPGAPSAALRSLITLSRACREERQVQCVYTRGDTGEARRLEPLHLAKSLGRWYLVAYCLERGAWRTFRVDRLTELDLTRLPSTHRVPPAENLDDYVRDNIRRAYRQATATVRVHAPITQVEHWIMPAWGSITRETDSTSLAEVGAESHEAIARWLLLLDAPITVIDPPELRDAFAVLADRCRRTANAHVPPTA